MSNVGDFDAVEAGSLLDFPTSPDVMAVPGFRGIKLNGPARVPLVGKPDRRGGFARMMVCGSYRFDSDYLGLMEDFRPHLLIVAVNASTHLAYIARSPQIENAVPYDGWAGKHLTPADWAGRTAIEFFNVNLVSLFGLPEQPAEYVVYAALGRYVSNVLRMRLE